MGIVKMSIVLFYMRLSGFSSRRWIRTLWVLFAIMCCVLIITILVTLLPCRPILWRLDIKAAAHMYTEPPVCLEVTQSITPLSVLYILSDALLLIIPVAMLWRVQMRWTIKLRVCLAGLVGCANIALSIVRTKENYYMKKDITCQCLLPLHLSSYLPPPLKQHHNHTFCS